MLGDYVIAQFIVWALGLVAKSNSKSVDDLSYALFVVFLLPFTFPMVFAHPTMVESSALERVGAVLFGLAEWAVVVVVVALGVGGIRSLLY
jgi:hypothetical protein